MILLEDFRQLWLPNVMHGPGIRFTFEQINFARRNRHFCPPRQVGHNSTPLYG